MWTAVVVVASPVALQDSSVASHATSWKLVLATCVNAMLVCKDCQWWAKFDLVELGRTWPNPLWIPRNGGWANSISAAVVAVSFQNAMLFH